MLEITAQTIQRAAQGDVAAFEDIYRKTSGFVYNVAWRMARNREDAEEIAQNVFVSVYRKLADFRFEASLKTWLYRITVNLALNYLKKTGRERDRTVSYDDAVAYPDAGIENIPAPMQEPADPQRVERMLGALNPDQRACIVLRSIEGLSYQEIARALNININTVRSRIKRARETLLALRKKELAQEVSL